MHCIDVSVPSGSLQCVRPGCPPSNNSIATALSTLGYDRLRIVKKAVRFTELFPYLNGVVVVPLADLLHFFRLGSLTVSRPALVPGAVGASEPPRCLAEPVDVLALRCAPESTSNPDCVCRWTSDCASDGPSLTLLARNTDRQTNSMHQLNVRATATYGFTIVPALSLVASVLQLVASLPFDLMGTRCDLPWAHQLWPLT